MQCLVFAQFCRGGILDVGGRYNKWEHDLLLVNGVQVWPSMDIMSFRLKHQDVTSQIAAFNHLNLVVGKSMTSKFLRPPLAKQRRRFRTTLDKSTTK